MPGLLSNFLTRGFPTQLTFNVQAGSTATLNERQFCWYDSANDTLKSVATLVNTWSSTKKARREATSRFVGLSNFVQTSLDPARKMTVDTNCFMTVKVASSTYKVGDMLGFQKDSGGNYLYGDTLGKVVHPADAIAWCGTRATSAVTEVEAFVFSSRELANQLLGGLIVLPFYINATNFIANAGTPVVSYLMGFDCRLVNMKFVPDVATTGANVIQIKNGSSTLDDTLTVAGSSAIGSFTEQDVDDAADYNIFKYGDGLNVVMDSGSTCSGGSGTLFLEFHTMPPV